jgi:hypothetical protein
LSNRNFQSYLRISNYNKDPNPSVDNAIDSIELFNIINNNNNNDYSSCPDIGFVFDADMSKTMVLL